MSYFSMSDLVSGMAMFSYVVSTVHNISVFHHDYSLVKI